MNAETENKEDSSAQVTDATPNDSCETSVPAEEVAPDTPQEETPAIKDQKQVSETAKAEQDKPVEPKTLIIETISEEPKIESPLSTEALSKHIQSLQVIDHEESLPEDAAAKAQRFFEDFIISNRRDDTASCSDSEDSDFDITTATDEQRAAWRQRRLNSRRTYHRFIFQDWPRDPKGKAIMKDGPERKGKQTSNGLEIWGATLFDFYMIRRFPDQMSGVTFSSGSRLAAWMKKHGEDYAKDQLQAAEEEEDPHLVWPYPVSKLITDSEKKSGVAKSWNRIEEAETKGEERVREYWEVPENWPPASIFSAEAYPSPWPDKPFSNRKDRLPSLQSYMTQSQLPEKLLVHDRRKLLRANGSYGAGIEEDITHVYKLVTSKTHTKRAKQDDDELKASDAKRRSIREEFLKDATSDKAHPSGIMVNRRNTPGPCQPLIFVVYPHLPERGRIPEAHLHLSPSGSLGVGNHSYVYRAELELPRSFLVDEVMCTKCVSEDLQQILREQDGPNNETRDPKWEELSGRYEYKFHHKVSGAMAAVKGEDGVERERLIRAPEDFARLTYIGPYRAIETRVQYQNLALGPYCEHLREDNIHPLTSKVSVAAKLSINGDRHLEREAENYQAFPRHFFEHWNGYNIVNPLQHPIPVTPIVPQYYGYYVVDERNTHIPKKPKEEKKPKGGSDENDSGESKSNTESEAEDSEDPEEDSDENTPPRTYLSPILLLEECGTPIEPKSLSIDDKHECAALIFKFHQGNWCHGSVARRNIVRQPGPLNASPEERKENSKKRGGRGQDWTYRLIDFGRSTPIEAARFNDNLRTVLEERTTMENWLHGGPLNL